MGTWDPLASAQRAKDSTPGELNSASRLARRRRFLDEALGDTEKARQFHERIIQGNELQDINYLSRGVRAADAIARIVIRRPDGRLAGHGSGFLVAPGLLLTNHHVLPDHASALRSSAEFRYERDISGRALTPIPFQLDPGRFFHAHEALDFALVSVAARSEQDNTDLSAFGFLPLIETLGKVVDGEWLTIVQHPNGERKQLCIRENQLLQIRGDVLWYSTDTVAGSSGSPVFNNDWIVVALHHSGIPEKKDGRIQTVDGRDWDPQRDGEDRIKWVANEGIRISRIVQQLRADHSENPLLAPIFNATPADAHRATFDRPGESLPSAFSNNSTISHQPTTMPLQESRQITVRLGISPKGEVSLLSGGSSARESAFFEEARRRAPRRERIHVPFDPTYADRNGFQPDLLGTAGKRVNLPTLTPAVRQLAAELIGSSGDIELKYHNYSVVMNKVRRLAIYSAANVRADQRYTLSRSSYSDESDWRADRRISESHQLVNFYYRGNRFDRGHLTRNEDLEFGPTPQAAMQSAIDTLHYTNIVPQHESFNAGKLRRGEDDGGLDLGLWGQLEKHILEQGIRANNFAAQVFTGPVLDEGDPDHPDFEDLPYPVRFWKVIAALDSAGDLFATAFLLDQTAIVDHFGITEAAPIDAFKTYQVPIAEIERLTGLLFTSGTGTTTASLSAVDPLGGSTPPRRRRRRDFNESSSPAAADDAPDSYLPLQNFTDIRTRG